MVCALNWGLGHATRSIPIVRKLLERGHEVILASDGVALDLLQSEFPGLKAHQLSGYNITYQKTGSFSLKIIGQVPKLLRRINKEHKELKQLAREEQPDLIISDNRYGCYVEGIRSIFITHQVHIQMPESIWFLQRIVNWWNVRNINRFQHCWIPDFAGECALVPLLSRGEEKLRSFTYLGTLSRLSENGRSISSDLFIILSGPEPQRSILERELLRQANSLKEKNVVIARGVPKAKDLLQAEPHVKVFNHIPTEEFAAYLKGANWWFPEPATVR